MATKTIGAAGDYTTIALWAAYVKALTTLTESEIGQLIDDAVYTYGANSDLDFSGVTLSGFTITMEGSGAGVHDGDFGNGARVEASAFSGGLYQAEDCIIQDFSIINTNPTSGGARCWLNTSATFKRVIAKSLSTGANSHAFQLGSGSDVEACRAIAQSNSACVQVVGTSSLKACSAIGGLVGFDTTISNSGAVQDNVAYDCTTGWSGTWSGTATNNSSEDGTHPGTSGVTLTGNPFEVDGYTPTPAGELDGAGVDLSISLDAANTSFSTPPSIGAYEIGVSATSAVISSTIIDKTNERDVELGGKQLICTITNDTFKAAGTGPIGSIADSQALIDGITSNGSETFGWNNVVRDAALTSAITRNSDTQFTFDLAAFGTFDITANETVTETIPTDALVIGAAPIVATPTFQILEVGGGAGSGTILNEDSQMQQLILAGTSQLVTVSIKNATTGNGLTGLLFNTAGLTAYYTREATGTPVAITLATMTAGTWASGGFVELDAANQPGLYQLGVPDAVAAAGEVYADISLKGAANMFDVNFKVELINQIDLGSDNRVLNSADAHASGETITGIAGTKNTLDDMNDFNSASDDVAVVTLVNTTTANTDMRGTDSAATSANLAITDGKIDDLQGASFDSATDSNEAIRNRGDAAWVTGAGGSAPTAEENRIEMDANSTRLAAINTDTDTTIPAQISALKDFDPANDDVAVVTTVTNKTGYALAVTPPTAIENRAEMDSNSTQLAAILNDTDISIPALIATLSAKTGTLAIPKNAIYLDFPILMLLTADNQPATGLTVTGERSIDGAAFEAVTGTITELSDGFYSFDSSAADTNGDSIVWLFKGTNANNSSVAFQTVR